MRSTQFHPSSARAAAALLGAPVLSNRPSVAAMFIPLADTDLPMLATYLPIQAEAQRQRRAELAALVQASTRDARLGAQVRTGTLDQLELIRSRSARVELPADVVYDAASSGRLPVACALFRPRTPPEAGIDLTAAGAACLARWSAFYQAKGFQQALGSQGSAQQGGAAIYRWSDASEPLVIQLDNVEPAHATACFPARPSLTLKAEARCVPGPSGLVDAEGIVNTALARAGFSRAEYDCVRQSFAWAMQDLLRPDGTAPAGGNGWPEHGLGEVRRRNVEWVRRHRVRLEGIHQELEDVT